LNRLLKRKQSLFASHSLCVAFFVLLLALVSVAASAAQTSKTDGALEGTISDPTLGILPSVKVV
jgi:hypothetical protein